MQIDFGYGEASGLPPFMSPQPETGAIGRDASSGLPTTVIDSQTWATNPAAGGELQLVYTIEPGGPVSSGGLFGLAQELYGNGNLWRQIYDVPQNKAMQGADPNTGLFIGDMILIPGLEPAQDPGGTQQTPGNGGLTPVDNGNGREIVFNGPPGNGRLSTVSRTTEITKTTETEKEGEGWWTPGRAAIAAGVLVGGVVLTTWVVTGGKKKPRRRRRRRRTTRRRR